MNLVEWSLVVEAGLQRPPLIRCNGKTALDEGWTTGPFDEPDEWRWKLNGYRGNVGCVTGRGRLVVDADLYKPGARDAWDLLVDQAKLSVHTVTAITGRGGAHYWYSCDPALQVASRELEPLGFPGIDVKAAGAYVVVEPSVHPDNGQVYRFEVGFGPGDVELAPATDELLGLLGAGPANARYRGRWKPIELAKPGDLHPVDIECTDLLVKYFGGHSPVVLAGGYIGVWRPGKVEGTASATVGYIGPGVVKFWSSHWEPFAQGQVCDVGQLKVMAGLGPRITVPDALPLPEGYRLWRPGDDDRPSPVLSSAARYGPVGQLLDLLEDQLEVNVAPVGAMFLVDIGVMVGRHAAIHIGEHRHHGNLFLLVVGESSTGGKGSADEAVERCITEVDRHFGTRHVVGGFGSGEALIFEVRDPRDDDDEEVEKRRVISEPEFSRVLRVAGRDQNILSQVIRQGFDYRPLQHRTKTHGAVVSTGHCLSVIGAITPKELAACSSELDIENGWLNRFLFVHSEIVRLLPFGGHVDRAKLGAVISQVRQALDEVEGRPMAEYFITEGTDAGRLWHPWYTRVREGTGSVPALTRRQHVHVARLALVLAVLDGAREITVEHLAAAMAWSDYSVATVERLFGRVATGKTAQLLLAIRDAGPDGLDGAGQAEVFHRNLKPGVLAGMRDELEERHLVATVTYPTGGRPRLVSYAIAPYGARKNESTKKGGQL